MEVHRLLYRSMSCSRSHQLINLPSVLAAVSRARGGADLSAVRRMESSLQHLESTTSRSENHLICIDSQFLCELAKTVHIASLEEGTFAPGTGPCSDIESAGPIPRREADGQMSPGEPCMASFQKIPVVPAEDSTLVPPNLNEHLHCSIYFSPEDMRSYTTWSQQKRDAWKRKAKVT